MTVLTADVVRPVAQSKQLTAYWRGHDLSAVATKATSQLRLSAHVLPRARIGGRPIYPIVRIDLESLRRRRSMELAPVLDRASLRAVAEQPSRLDSLPAVVSMTGFLTVEPLARALPILGGFSGWARTIAAVPQWTRITPMNAAACDYYGHTVVTSDGDTTDVAIAGHAGAAPGSATVRDAWQLLREEQLFDLAISSGTISWP